MFTRRNFIAVGAMAGLSACATTPPPIPATVPSPPVIPPLPDFYGAITTEPYPIPAIPMPRCSTLSKMKIALFGTG